MSDKSPFLSIALRLGFLTLLVFAAAHSTWAQTIDVLHTFGSGTDGYFASGGLVADAKGNLYGTTQYGGHGTAKCSEYSYGCGTAYELSLSTSGWTETVLYNFGGTKSDGYCPYVGMVFDKSGSLYGVTEFGGAFGSYGTVFELSPTSSGAWKEKILHSFGNGTDGVVPVGTLIFDSAGNIYGTTQLGGTYGYGTVYELSPKTGGGWSETVLHSFNNNGTDGATPLGSLIFDSHGNLYGTTYSGGAHSLGTIYEISPNTSGGWKEQVLFSFNGKTGANPTNGFAVNASGNFYSTTLYGGNNSGCGGGGCGTVFEFANSGGHWVLTTLHSFEANGTDGFEPHSSLTFDAAGNLYGTTIFGGTGNCNRGQGCGTVYELANGTWAETVYSLATSSEGSSPYAGVILDSAGNIYGTTVNDGAYNGALDGTVFEITP